MSEPRIDMIARLLARKRPRRRVLGALAAGLVAAGLVAPPTPALLCKQVGQRCDPTAACCAGSVCKRNTCRCRAGLTDCGADGCRHLPTDEDHCGACGNACAGGVMAETCCGGQCVNLLTSRDHCGACGNACRSDQFCTPKGCGSMEEDDDRAPIDSTGDVSSGLDVPPQAGDLP
jgi:hypothetical protein